MAEIRHLSFLWKILISIGRLCMRVTQDSEMLTRPIFSDTVLLQCLLHLPHNTSSELEGALTISQKRDVTLVLQSDLPHHYYLHPWLSLCGTKAKDHFLKFLKGLRLIHTKFCQIFSVPQLYFCEHTCEGGGCLYYVEAVVVS